MLPTPPAPWLELPLEPLPSREPRPALGPNHDRPLIARIVDRELDHQVPLRQERLDGVAPLDEQDAVLGRLLELEVEDVLDPFEPIDVGVDEIDREG